MEAGHLLEGLIIGFSIAAPMGPIGLLCIRRTLSNGRVAGMASGLGAASADAVFGCIAGFGLTVVSAVLIDQQAWLKCAGGSYLCYLGLRTFRARPTTRSAAVRGRGLPGAFASTFLLTLTNPVTILSFLGIFSALAPGTTGDARGSAAVLVAGVFIGSALWWLLLSVSVGSLRPRLDDSRMTWINRFSGLVLGGFGLTAIASLV